MFLSAACITRPMTITSTAFLTSRAEILYDLCGAADLSHEYWGCKEPGQGVQAKLRFFQQSCWVISKSELLLGDGELRTSLV